MRDETGAAIRLADYKPCDYAIDTISLAFNLEPTATRVRAFSTVKRVGAAGKPLVLDGAALTLERIAVNGKALSADEYAIEPEKLVIHAPPQAFTLEIDTLINPAANTALEGLYVSGGRFCTQCEAEGFRKITYALDRPDALARYTVRMEADKSRYPTLLSNGDPIESGDLPGERHYAVWNDPHPKPAYLFALVAGAFDSIHDTFTTMYGKKVDLGIYVDDGESGRAHYAMDALKRSMAWDEQVFKREYDLGVFNIVAVRDFNFGAMENKGLNIFNAAYVLADADTATDTDFEAIEGVVAHEYFHNWTGNRITLRDWFQLCLKEGLTVYRDQEFSADERSAVVQRITDVRQLRAIQFAEDAGPLAHPVRPESYIEINNFYTATVYDKGAELVRMIETLAGRDGFRKGMDLYFARHDGDAATVEDFIVCFEEACGLDLGQFRLWYSQAGTPELVCKLTYDKTKRTAELHVEQVAGPTPGQPTKKPQLIPLRLGLIGHNGGEIPLQLASGEPIADGVVRVTKRSQTFKFVDVPSQPVPSLLRGFSAPVKLTADIPDRDLAFLMRTDSDLFARWQAANDYATRLLILGVRGRDKSALAERVAAYAEAIGASLADTGLEPAYKAELLKLPTETDIAREIARNIDPSAIHAARVQMQRTMGRILGDTLEKAYKANHDKAFSPDAASAGRRALRNQCLALLAMRNTPADRERLAAHYRKSTNMTDQSHALALIAMRGGAEAEAALTHFHDRWKDDHLVIDTWFSVQAIVPRSSTLARIRKLTRHPLYSAKAPNKVRALIGAFAMSNPVQFNRPDGKGYELLADQVLAIEGFNPQIAARLLGSLRSWRALEPKRRALAKAELKRIAAKDGLSRDVYEIAKRMLE